MPLSNDLISQFVKVTKDTKKDKSESIVYGTIVSQSDANYVKIDGSELLTPISYTTVVGDGDRVTVMIKNHTAIVTGNLSSPAARNKDTLSVDKLDAVNGRIDNLEAANVTIQGTLNTNVADVDALTTRVTAAESNITAAQTTANNAAKTATNFLSLSTTDGLIVGDKTASTLGGNIQLKAETNGASIALRDGTTILSKFSATSKAFSGVTTVTT